MPDRLRGPRPAARARAARGPRARRARTGSCTSAFTIETGSSVASSSRRAGSGARGGAGSRMRPPPSVVPSRRTIRSSRAATTGAASRSCAKRSPTRTTRARISVVPWCTCTRVWSPIGSSSVELDVEAVADGIGARLDERVAASSALRSMPGSASATRCPASARSTGSVVHLDAAHAHVDAGRLGAELVALADRARPERARDDGADPVQRERAVDVEARRAERAARARTASAARRARCAARRAPRRSSRSPRRPPRRERARGPPRRASSSVSASTASAFVTATTPRSIPSSRRIARCSCVCGRAPSVASITSRKRSIPLAPATMLRMNRSWPGTSISDSRAAVGQVERRVAEVDRDPALLLLRQPVGVLPGQRPDEPGLAVVDVARCADRQRHRASISPSSMLTGSKPCSSSSSRHCASFRSRPREEREHQQVEPLRAVRLVARPGRPPR